MNIFLTPAEPFELFSYCDFAILIGLNLIFYFLIKYKYIERFPAFKAIIAILYIIIIPIISNMIEVKNVYRTYTVVDGFNLLYTILKVPFWWLIGLINILIIRLFIKKPKEKKSEFPLEVKDPLNIKF